MLNKIIKEELIHKAQKLLDDNDKIVIVSHVSPDGDAIGSSLGLYHFLLQLGKQANVIVPDRFPDFLKWMKGAGDILLASEHEELAKETIQAADLIFCLDFNDLHRISMLGPMVKEASAKKIMIDHHLNPEPFCDLTISYPEISSCAELVFRFICRIGMFDYINKTVAECIYTGMMTDTGAFTFNSNTPEIYYIISELLKCGINKDAIYAKVYNTYSETRVRLQGFVLYEKMKIYPEYKTALITLSSEETKRFNMQKGDTEGFVNIPLTINDIVFSAFLREDNDQIRISLRSKGDFPTNIFASEVFNGGGHLNASGGEFNGTLEDAISHFEKSLPNYKDLL